MSAEAVLIAGKALIWLAIPLAIAGWEPWRLGELGAEGRVPELDASKHEQPDLFAELVSLLDQNERARGWFDEFENNRLDHSRAAELYAARAPGRTIGPIASSDCPAAAGWPRCFSRPRSTRNSVAPWR